MTILIKSGRIVNEGCSVLGDIVITDDIISGVYAQGETPRGVYDKIVDASGCFVIPGVIDDHVHFREPGLTRKADIASESRAAACGGVTSYMEMPNTSPQTTCIEALEEKKRIAQRNSLVNYAFFYGATNSNADTFESLDRHEIPGIKLFMGASTGNMLVDRAESLNGIFKICADNDLLLMTHCEDTDIITANMKVAKEEKEDPDIIMHPLIRSEVACYKSTSVAVDLARKYGTRLHVAHVSTAHELEFFGRNDKITAEAVIAHIFFSDVDYKTLGALIKCNPAVKTVQDRNEIRRALNDGRITNIGTDHAPHELKDKQGGCAKAASGMPMVQFSLVTMFELVDDGVLSVERLVELMCHNPAMLFNVYKRGFLRAGYKADIVVVKPGCKWMVEKNIIRSKCKWSPMEGHTYNNKVKTTICNGHVVYDDDTLFDESRGEALVFNM
jgi:dihydroorotase